MERIVRRLPSAHMENYCAFVGMDGSLEDAGFSVRLFDSLEMLIFEGYTHFICDASGRAGLQAAELVSMLRANYPEITLELAFPCDIRTQGCPADVLDLAYRADVITFVSRRIDLNATRRLKKYLIDQASLVIAECDGQTGMMDPAVQQARREGKQVTSLPNAVRHLAMAI